MNADHTIHRQTKIRAEGSPVTFAKLSSLSQ